MRPSGPSFGEQRTIPSAPKVDIQESYLNAKVANVVIDEEWMFPQDSWSSITKNLPQPSHVQQQIKFHPLDKPIEPPSTLAKPIRRRKAPDLITSFQSPNWSLLYSTLQVKADNLKVKDTDTHDHEDLAEDADTNKADTCRGSALDMLSELEEEMKAVTSIVDLLKEEV